jgi:hypothetical protein
MQTTIRIGAVLILFCGMGVAAVGHAAGRERQKAATKSETGFGLHTATFEMPHGRIKVNLPDDMAAGDTISGTVLGDPAGKTEEERRRNTDELNGYVVEIDNARTTVNQKSFKWAVPVVVAGTLAKILLRDRDRNEVGNVEVPIKPRPPVLQRPAVLSPEDFQLPLLGQAQRPIQLTGPFDGDFATTGLKMGGQDLQMLAESPRKLIAESPNNIIGPTDIELKEGDIVVKGRINNLRVALTMPRTMLHKGERTSVTTTFEGLKSAPPEAFPIRYQLINRSPQIAELGETGATTLSQQIPYNAVTPEGTCAFSTPVHALQAGGFAIAVVVDNAWLGGDGWEAQKALLKTSEDFNAWVDALKKDLSEYAKKQGNDRVGQAQKTNAENAAENLPKSENNNDLEEKKLLADLVLRPVSIVKAFASLWLSGFELYKVAIKAIVGAIGGEEVEIPWDAIDKGLDFLDKEADTLNDKDLKKKVKDARAAKDAAKKAKGAKDKLEKLKDALDKANQQYDRSRSK